MYFESREVISRSIDDVYPVVRDNLPDLVPFWPNIDQIEVLKVKHAKKTNNTKIVNNWKVKFDLPLLARKFIKRDIFSLKNEAVWYNDKYYVAYTFKSNWIDGLLDIKGKNYFKAVKPKKTEVRVTFDIKVYPEKLTSMPWPSIIIKKVLPNVDKTLKRVLAPNLMNITTGINNYFNYS